MSSIKQFYKLTTELIQFLEKSEEERDEKITHVEDLLNQREYIMKDINPPYTTEETELGKEIVKLNTKLARLLQDEKASVQKDIKDLQIKKNSNTRYVNPYQSLSTDGMFYDKRK
ncbi:flagellar protein FliT [Mesobacillus sp. AQ2]|uniref:flagellar protein FliT n=1 Tax=Mesobacillus sp. AQ2 TaxID=3043332 RepID=UPI0024C1CF3C|nr:flagellar protein FliT [Mesobacillus sp. AQ2]WHX40214.1 flagellar protein FliT [Mesobacillus sp. AQ2]